MIDLQTLELLQQNIRELKTLVTDEKLELSHNERIIIARGLIFNLEDSLEEFIEKI